MAGGAIRAADTASPRCPRPAPVPAAIRRGPGHRCASLRPSGNTCAGGTPRAPLGRHRVGATGGVRSLQHAAALRDGPLAIGAGADAVEAVLLAFEELASNGLRHGRPPEGLIFERCAGFRP